MFFVIVSLFSFEDLWFCSIIDYVFEVLYDRVVNLILLFGLCLFEVEVVL